MFETKTLDFKPYYHNINDTYLILPSFTTERLDKASGTLTPAATNVKPITVSGIPSVFPVDDKLNYCNFSLFLNLMKTSSI